MKSLTVHFLLTNSTTVILNGKKCVETQILRPYVTPPFKTIGIDITKETSHI